MPVTEHIAAADADRHARDAALTLAFTLPADAVLYLLLPLHAADFGITLLEAGVLLAANRLVRIVGYGWVARFYAERGPRAACLAAAAGSVLAALGYVVLSGVAALLVARLVWGLSFAAMNIANQALPTAVIEGAARRSGRARAVVAVGPMIALVAGAAIDALAGPRVVFLLLAAASAVAPAFAARLPDTRQAIRQERPRLAWPEPISTWSFCMGLTLDGLFVFGLSLIAAQAIPSGAVLAAGTAMALRYLLEVVLSPVGGIWAQRFGARRLLVILSLASAPALFLLGTSGALLWTGVVATVTLRALLQPLPAPVVAEAVPAEERVPALARQAVWRDLGAGVGPLIAGVAFPVAPAGVIFGVAALALAGASLGLLGVRRGGLHSV